MNSVINEIIPTKKRRFLSLINLLRIHQWLKNLLLVTPLLAAHHPLTFEIASILLVAFFSFSFCASSVYILNDILDIEHDRQHPRKCRRSLAAGRVTTQLGIILSMLLLVLSLGLATFINLVFFKCLLSYYLITSTYSWKLKRYPLIDCLLLAASYTMRIIAGAVAIALPLSFWFLSSAVFLFLSLAFIKRYAELTLNQNSPMQESAEGTSMHKQKLPGRGYYLTDAPLIQNLGITSGYLAVLVFALYLNSIEVLRLYKTVEFIWGAVAILLFWISWMWLQAQRGKMHDDPLLFAIRDKISLLAGALFSCMLVLGSVSWPSW